MIKWVNACMVSMASQCNLSTQTTSACTVYKNQRHNFKLTKMSLEKIIDEICEISFDLLEEFCQGATNCFIGCTIDGQNNLVDIKLIIERNERLFLNSNLTLEVKLTLICLLIFGADTNLVLKIVKNGIRFIF